MSSRRYALNFKNRRFDPCYLSRSLDPCKYVDTKMIFSCSDKMHDFTLGFYKKNSK